MQLPYFSTQALPVPVETTTIEFRHVKIDTDFPPKYADNTDIVIGDLFFFNASHECIKCKSPSDSSSSDQILPDGTIIFIVVGGGSPQAEIFADASAPDADGDWNTSLSGVQNIVVYYIQNNSNWLTWNQVFTKIKDLLGWQASRNSAYLYTITTTNPDSFFDIEFTKDPVLQKEFAAYKSAINEALSFELCGTNLSTNTDHADWPSNLILNELALSRSGWESDAEYYDYTMTPSNQEWTDGDGKIYDRNEAVVVDDGDPATNEGWFQDNYYELLKSSGYTGSASLEIDYVDVLSSSPTYEDLPAKYTDVIGRRIDRKVQYRNTENSISSYEGILNGTIAKASSFGKLKKTLDLIPHKREFYDALLPDIGVSDNIDLSSITDLVTYDGTSAVAGQVWILDTFQKKNNAQFKTSLIEVKLSNVGSAAIYTNNSDNIDLVYANNIPNLASNIIAFPLVVGSSETKLKVTNYIQAEFRGSKDYSGLTSKNLYFMFGQESRGNHTIRPKRSNFNGYNPVAKSASSNWSSELILDPPRGSRFGLMIYNQKPKYSFVSTHFGYLRDMLEQSLDTKFVNHASDERIFGSAVVVNAINITNPEIPKLMANTSRYNKTIDATITRPYIESNYEAIQQPVNLESETLRVDVAGAIRSNRVLAPGSITSNIRSR